LGPLAAAQLTAVTVEAVSLERQAVVRTIRFCLPSSPAAAVEMATEVPRMLSAGQAEVFFN
jgi:hypothetical protein